MFERFTDQARRVVTLAQDEGRTQGYGRIGTEHILIALLREGDGVAAHVLTSAGVTEAVVRADVRRAVAGGGPGSADLVPPADADALRAIGIDVDAIRERIEESFGPGALAAAARSRRRRRDRAGGCPSPVSGHVPFTPRSKKVLELSLREAISLRHNHIGTEHILLGLLREGEGLAARVLVDRGVNLDDLRRRVLTALGKVA